MGYSILDVDVRHIELSVTRWASGSWTINLQTSRFGSGNRLVVPVASGDPGAPCTQDQYLECLELVREALVVAIAELIEPV
jgi:hypothetical protein